MGTSLANNVDGVGNVAVGARALSNNISGDENTAIGNLSLLTKASGDYNVAVGGSALAQLTTGSGNVCVSHGAGFFIGSGDGNVCIGTGVGEGSENNTTRIKNIGSTPQGGGLTVTVESVGGTKLGYVPSSRRYKEDIRSIDNASEALFALHPVTFRYKKKIDPAQMPAFGLVAEEVEKINPELVAHNPEGQPESVRYGYINAMLLNEFRERATNGEGTGVQDSGTRCYDCAVEERSGNARCARQRAGFKNSKGKRADRIRPSRAAG